MAFETQAQRELRRFDEAKLVLANKRAMELALAKNGRIEPGVYFVTRAGRMVGLAEYRKGMAALIRHNRRVMSRDGRNGQ